VFTIADPSSVWLLANVRETDSGSVRVGQAMDVHVPAYPKRVFKARVNYVAALVDPVTHRLPVRAEIENLDGALKPEMFASFRILTGEATDSPAVPESAVVYEGDLAHVWVLAYGGLLAYRAIRTGRTSEGLIEVLDGLKAGERIVKLLVHAANRRAAARALAAACAAVEVWPVRTNAAFLARLAGDAAFPTGEEIQALVQRLSERLGRHLERRGWLVRDAESSHLNFEPRAADDGLADLQGRSPTASRWVRSGAVRRSRCKAYPRQRLRTAPIGWRSAPGSRCTPA
jgi:hypothetical protein